MREKELAALIAEANQKPYDRRLPEPWTLDDIADERDRARANDWKLAQRWPWVDAVAWIAMGGPAVLPLLSACRSKFGRQEGADPINIERQCWSVLKTRVDRLSLDEAERVLRGWCRAGLLPVDGSGAPVGLPDHRPAYEAMLSASDIQRLSSSGRDRSPQVAPDSSILIRRSPSAAELSAWAESVGNVSRASIDKPFIEQTWRHDNPRVRPSIAEAKHALDQAHGKRSRGRSPKSNEK